MARRKSFAALEEPKEEPAPAPEPAAEVSEAPDEPMLPIKAPRIAKARRGKKQIAGFFPPSVQKAVKLLAVENDKTVEAMLGEAINLLLRHYGKHPEKMD